MKLDRGEEHDRSHGTFASICVLSRWDSELQALQRNGNTVAFDFGAPDLFLRQSFRRIRSFLEGLGDNDDKAVIATANALLASSPR